MDPDKQREIASKGGKAAHEKGTAHEFTSEEARVAGRKGGAASRMRRAKNGADGGGPNDGEAAMAQSGQNHDQAAAAGQ
jgi:hypothetical protein